MMKKNASDLIFVKWIIGVVFFLTFIFILNYFGFMSSLIKNDASYITSMILIIFIYFSIKVGIELFYLRARYMNINILFSILSGDSIGDIDSILKRFKHSNNYDDKSIYIYVTSNIENASTKENFEYTLTSKLNTGWLAADGLLKLGLIGTVIGFIIMLSAITEIDGFDFTMMKEMLQNMSGGMEVALYTTLSGLVSSILLTIQYSYLEYYIYKIFYIANSCLSHYSVKYSTTNNDE